MQTFEYLKTYLRDIVGLKRVEDEILRSAIRASTTPLQFSYADLLPTTTDDMFELGTLPFRDYSLRAFRASSADGLVDTANQLVLEEFDCDTTPLVAATEDLQVDYAKATLRFKTPFDPDTEFLALLVGVVDTEAVTDRLLSQLALTDQITETTRGNITIKRKGYAGILAERQSSGAGAGAVVEEVTMTRRAHGKVYGVDPDTGEVV